jgi:signal peptidase I
LPDSVGRKSNSSRKPATRFFFPKPTPAFFVRLILIAAAAWVIFGYVLVPIRVRGRSMAPTYRDGDFLFCWRLAYRLPGFSDSPAVGDVVFAALAGGSVMLLKRVVALEFDVVSFVNGVLHVNGKPRSEPYVKYPCNWNLPPRRVKKNHVYLVGDNRSVSIKRHQFGQTRITRIRGTPTW